MPRAHRGDASERGTRVTTADWVQLVTDALDKIVIPLAGLAIAWSITHWGLRQKAEATLARQDLLGRVAREAVAAAEQALAGQAGADKRAAALNFAVSFLAARGITPTPAEEQALGAAIEAAVRDLKVGRAARRAHRPGRRDRHAGAGAGGERDGAARAGPAGRHDAFRPDAGSATRRDHRDDRRAGLRRAGHDHECDGGYGAGSARAAACGQ